MPDDPKQPTEPTQADADELDRQLRKLADDWRRRLADPAMAALVREGKVTVSPLVTDLLKLFPPNSAG